MKGKVKRIVSGVLSAMTLLTSAVQPAFVYASEAGPAGYEAEYPPFEQVKGRLDADEAVTAEDYEMEAGDSFDVENDLSGISFDAGKVKVKFHEAADQSGSRFDGNRAGTYRAVYLVKPSGGHPSYHVCRNIIVKKPAAEKQEEKGASGSGQPGRQEDSGNEDDEDGSGQEDARSADTAAESQAVQDGGTEAAENPDAADGGMEQAEETVADGMDQEDEKSGLTVDEAMEQAEGQGIDLLAMDEGESVVFYASAGEKAEEKVTVTRGDCFRYADYGLGTYLTYRYTVQFGDVSATAYCVQPSKDSPDSGTFGITKLKDKKGLSKVCYYGTKASGDDGFFAEKYPDFPYAQRFILVHMAASHANGSEDAFSGASSTGRELAMELYDYCMAQPEIPDVEMSFSSDSVKAYVDGDIQRTKEVVFKADELQTITMKLPEGVKLHNVDTGKTSKAGADVEVTGGTRFYLSAPLTQAEDVSAEWQARMKGSITKDYSAYKISTGSGSQDLALVFGEGVADEKYVVFSVSWVEPAKIRVVKVDADHKDARLSGAVFGVYEDKGCTKLIVKMPATNSNGAAAVEMIRTQDTVYLKEVTAPEGYGLNETVYKVNLDAGGTVTTTVPDKELLGGLSVSKEGQALAGADRNSSGTVFRYEKRRLPGAEFNVYAGADITTAYGTKVFSRGDLVKAGLVTGADGTASLDGLHAGTYIVREMKAPENFYNAGEEKTVTVQAAEQDAETVFSEASFTDERQKAAVSILKKDRDTGSVMGGVTFGLYAAENIRNADGAEIAARGTLIEKVTTAADGTAVFSSDLPAGFSYSVKEEQAPVGYVLNTEDVYAFRFAYTNDREASVSFSHTFTNKRASAKITLHKKDAETGKASPQGDASLEHAVYGLYAREDIMRPDGSGTAYKAGSQVAVLTTGRDGRAYADNLYLGKYYVKEITPPVGYLADTREYDLVCSYEGDMTAEVERECTSLEQVKKQPFQIIKAGYNGSTDVGLLAGAGFTAWLESSLTKKADGNYDFSSASPVVIGRNGETEIFTDKKGYACSAALPYGTYIVRETTTPHNYKPVKDFTVRITENSPDTPQMWRVLFDDEFTAKLKIIKQDDETKRPVLVKGAEFKVYDMNNNRYVEQVTTYPVTVRHESYFTDENGYLILPQNLGAGRYRIEEVTAPDGYTLNRDYIEVSIDSDAACQMDGISGDVIIEAVYEDHPVKGQIRIVKRGEVLDSFGDGFSYKEENLAGAVFAVYAAEDIYRADFQKNADGSRILAYADGQLAGTVTTDGNGEAALSGLPLGAYRIVETKAPDGFVLNGQGQTVTLACEGQDVPVVTQTAEITDRRQKVEVSVTKKDSDTKEPLSGAGFGLYAKADILAHGVVIAEKDTLLAEAVSGRDGKAVFAADIPFGDYYIRELAAPAGYASSGETVEITAAYQGQDVETVQMPSVFKNEPTKVLVKKTDLATGVTVSGAALSVIDKDGNVIDRWESEKNEGHLVERLTAGETYTLREESAPYGYLLAEEVQFTVEDTDEIQEVVMKDDVPTARLIISKEGEFLEDVSALDSVSGWIDHFFEYITGSLKDVTFEVYALEDIKAADGESADYYKKDDLIGTITTDSTGIAELPGLPLGRYYVKEKATAEGYVLDDKAREIDLTYRDQYTAEVTYSSDWLNNRQKAGVRVLKKEKGSDRVLEGAVFALCAKEDITNADGRVIMKADTVIEEKATDADGMLAFTADLPIGCDYYIKETSPAPGFATAQDVQEFTFTYGDAAEESIIYEFTFEDEPVIFEFLKLSLKDGSRVEGAALQLSDADGNVVESWISGTEPHTIRELVVGKKYTLTETRPADGYVTAEDIVFTVEDTGEIQEVAMEDDVTKTEISKQDFGGKELPGAEFSILDKDGNAMESWVSGEEPHYIEMLPVGDYVLHEEKTPDGYVTAEDIPFTVEDTGEIQKVMMKDDVTKLEISKQDFGGKELPGAKLSILDKDGNVMESWVSGEEPHYIEMLPVGDYVLHEEKTPDGYVTAEDIPFTVEDTGEIQKVMMKDDVTKLEISKQDFGGKELPGAEISILDKGGKTVESWISGEEPHYIEMLPVGDYVLREEKTPDGYATAEDIPFTVKDTGEIQKVTMKDDVTKVEISKQDSGGKELPGARLYIFNQAGKIVENWISAEKPHYIEMLPVGDYVLHEETAPDGYATAEDIPFTVKDTGEIQKVTMKDEMTKTLVSKQETGGKELPGAKLTVLDKDGKAVESWVSGEKPHYIEKLPVGDYVLREETAPDGYVTAEDVPFTVKDTGKIQKVTMKDDVTKALISKQEIGGKELPGAKLAILDQDGKAVESWVSGEKPYYIEKLPAGDYVLREETAPDGYVTAEDVPFTVKDTGKIQKVTMKDDVTKALISKQEIGGKELPGAKLAILDKDGKAVESWVSEEKPHYIEKLPVGDYVLREETAPDGYVTAEDIPFTVEDTGEIQKVTMKDDITKALISKQDIGGAELPGAELAILDKDGKTVESWVSGDQPHYIEKLPVGDYVLREETAPDGYVTAEDIPFTVEDTGEIQKVTMKDDVTKAEISKQDIGGKELPGAELLILDKDGKTVESWVSGEKPHYIEKLPVGDYVLREETAPEGYLTAEDVAFTVEDTGEIQKVVMVDEKEPSDTPDTPPSDTPPSDTPPSGNPKTGDERNWIVWIALALLAACGAAGSIVLLAKERRDKRR